LVTLPKNCWPRVLGSVVIQLTEPDSAVSALKALSATLKVCRSVPSPET